MFGNVNITNTIRSSGKNRGNSKVSAFFQARAVDEALGGFLSKNGTLYRNGNAYSLLFGLAVCRAWQMQGCKSEEAVRGVFNFSKREFDAHLGRERLTLKKGQQQPSVTRGPDDGFEELVRAEAARIREVIESGNVPDEWFYTVRFWNEMRPGIGYAEDCPNPNQKDMPYTPVEAMEKKNDTAAFIEYYKPSEEQKQMMLRILEDNLIENPEDYKYNPPR